MKANEPVVVPGEDLSWPERLRRRAVLVAAVFLGLVLWLNLFAALFGTLAGYVLTAMVRRPQTQHSTRRRIANALLALLLVAGGVIALVAGVRLLLDASTDGLPKLMQMLADTLDHIRSVAPAWAATPLPDSAEAVQRIISGWLRGHAGEMQHWGREVLRIALHVVLGLVIGVMADLAIEKRTLSAPLPALAVARWRQLALAFRDVLSAQLRIAVVNALLTAAYLLGVLPALGVHIPLAMTLVGFTFFASLLPLIGNLMSNTAIVIAALTVGPWVGLASLVFLVAVHKLEYFLNAHFVGTRVDMPVFALLASMLLLEAAFGLGGIVAAPVYCAWLTRELRINGWIGH